MPALGDAVRVSGRTAGAAAVIWIHPRDCDPPHAPARWDQVDALAEAFAAEGGFREGEPCLIGYPWGARVQLLSGSHRFEAAVRACVLLPVELWLSSDVERAWGTPLWAEIMRPIPVVR